MIRENIVKLSQRQALTEAEAHGAMLEILEGKASPAQIAAYLAFLGARSETPEEVVGSVKAMREKMLQVDDQGLDPIDVCGTGGDHRGTFNLSTASALVLAGGGVAVAKHGNRAASSQCGSAEVLDALGVKLDVPVRVVENCLREAKVAFLFAPHFHPAMKNVAPIRKELGIRTLFNILGPMCNPASVRRQVVGVFDPAKARLMAESLLKLGSAKVVTLHSEDGLDEVSCAAPTTLWEGDPKGGIRESKIRPEDFGYEPHPLETLKGGDAAVNAKIVQGVLEGEKGPRREAVVLNAALGFYLAGKCGSPAEGKKPAEDAIDSGKALKALETLKKVSHQ